MATKNNIFEDFARVSTNLASGFFESGKNVSEGLRSKAQSLAKSADLVTRDEFEVIKTMASRIRLENETILKDMAELKQQMQVIASAVDIIKESSRSGAGVDNQELMAGLKTFAENVENKIIEFGDVLKNQQGEIDKINSTLKPAAKAKKNETSNPGLFDNEQN